MTASLSFDVDQWRDLFCGLRKNIPEVAIQFFVAQRSQPCHDVPAHLVGGQENGKRNPLSAPSCARLVRLWLQKSIHRHNAARNHAQPLGKPKGRLFPAREDVAQMCVGALSGFRNLRYGHFSGPSPAKHWVFGHDGAYFHQKYQMSTGNISGRNRLSVRGLSTMQHEQAA